MTTKILLVAAAALAISGPALAQVGTAPAGAPVVGPANPNGAVASPGAAGDRARTGRSAIGTAPGVTDTTTGTVTGTTPPITGSASDAVEGSVSGDGSRGTVGTTGAGGTPPQGPR